MIEDRIEELTGALEVLTAKIETLSAVIGMQTNQGDTDTMKPEQLELELEVGEVEYVPTPTASKKKVSKKKGSKKKASKKKVQHTIEEVRESLTAIDRDSAIEVLKSFGVSKLTQLDVEDFDKVIEEAALYADPGATDADDILV